MTGTFTDVWHSQNLQQLFARLAEYPWDEKRVRRGRRRGPDPDALTEKEVESLIADWSPKPLTPPMSELQKLNLDSMSIIGSEPAGKIVVNGRELINMTTTDFLAMQSNFDVKVASERALRKYGCGTCGPRGFYGTLDVHMDLESEMAKWMGVENAVLYSSNFVALASAIPAFCKVTDTIFVDRGVNLSIQLGCELARSRVIYYDHNSADSLERALERIAKEDYEKQPKIYRKFVVFEGLFAYTADIVPLPRILELKEKYKFRILMDDSFALGVLGNTGRGTCEYYGIETKKVDLVSSSLGNSFAAMGGIVMGGEFAAFHQRLMSSGYVFSASTPAYLAVAPTEAIRLNANANGEFQRTLKSLIASFRSSFGSHKVKGVRLDGIPESPVIHLRLDRFKDELSRLEEVKLLQQIVDEAANKGVFLQRAKYSPREIEAPQSSIRLAISLHHTPELLATVASVIAASVLKVL